jgi:hypothetical protein
MELYRFTIGIFILWKIEDAKKRVRMAIPMPMYCTPAVTKMFSLCYVGPLPLRFFSQVPYMPHIMNLKKLRFVHFNKVMETGVKGCWPCPAGSIKTLSSSFKCYNLKIYVVKNSKKNSTYSHTNIRSYLMVEVLKKRIFFAWPFSSLHGDSFWVFLEKHSQGTLGVKQRCMCKQK